MRFCAGPQTKELHHSIAMKKFLRPIAVLCAAALLGACVSPYRAQMGALHNAYLRGDVSPEEYRREMTHLQISDAGWQQQNANAATTAAVVGVAAIGTAALLNNSHHHSRWHDGRWHNGHWHRGHWN